VLVNGFQRPGLALEEGGVGLKFDS
jgi:hypothetical protein